MKIILNMKNPILWLNYIGYEKNVKIQNGLLKRGL